MKLLFDENLSHTLVGSLTNEFPDSTHVRDVGLRGAHDAHRYVVSDNVDKCPFCQHCRLVQNE